MPDHLYRSVPFTGGCGQSGLALQALPQKTAATSPPGLLKFTKEDLRVSLFSRAQDYYHWRELPQVSFLSRQSFLLLSRQRVCRNKTGLLSRQKYGCCDKTFVETKLKNSQNIFYLSRQNKSFVAIKLRKYHFCRDKSFFATNVFVATNVCWDKRNFVATNTCLSRQKLYLWQLPSMTAYIPLVSLLPILPFPALNVSRLSLYGLYPFLW